jgi:dTDP-glucose pyrophosphorylase
MTEPIIKSDENIEKAMRILDSSAEKCLFVVSDQKKYLGTLTDGDIRRSILSGSRFKKKISSIYNKNSMFFLHGVHKEKDILKKMHEKKITVVPILNNNYQVIDFISLFKKKSSSKKVNETLKDVSVIIMAGGKGSRMEPFTKILPKPLIPIKGEPIIKHIINSFHQFGCSEFHLSINYKSRIIKAYFEDEAPNYGLNFIEEKEPLGTAGSLKLYQGKVNSPFFVTNCDILIKSDYKKIYDFHLENKFDLTLVASMKQYIIPYGVCNLDEKGEFQKISEKPEHDLLINTGLYILNPEVLDFIPRNKFYHITDLIHDLKSHKLKIGVYPIDEKSWVDIGQWPEYQRAVSRL